MKKIFLCSAFLSLIPVFLFASEPPKHSYKPPQGYVPDEATATNIAEAVLTPIYGKEKIESERPFKAELKDGSWNITGTLHCPDGEGTCAGGVAEVDVSKDDGRILRVSHGQ